MFDMNQQEIINTIALTRIGYFGMAGLVELYQRVGSATEIVANRQDIRAIVPDARESSQPRIEPRSPTLQADSLPAKPPGKS